MNWKMFALVCTMAAAVALAADEIPEKYPVAENGGTYWVDMHHYTSAGYELLASQIVEKVAEKLSSAGAQVTRGQGLYRCQVHRGGGRDTRPDNSLETFLICSLGFDNFAMDDPLVLFELLPELRR